MPLMLIVFGKFLERRFGYQTSRPRAVAQVHSMFDQTPVKDSSSLQVLQQSETPNHNESTILPALQPHKDSLEVQSTQKAKDDDLEDRTSTAPLHRMTMDEFKREVQDEFVRK